MEAEQPVRAVPVLEYAHWSRADAISRWLQVWSIYLFAALLGGGLGASVAWIIIPPRYSAGAVINIRPTSSPFTARPQFLYTQVTQLMSAPVLNSASQKLINHLSLTSADWDRASIDAQVDRRSDLIRLHVTHANPAHASAIAGAVLESYVAHALQAPAIEIDIFEPPAPANMLQPHRDQRLLSVAAAFGALAGLIALALYRQRRAA